LKIYNSGGIGLLELWGSGTKQVYMGTDGKLYAGGGNVRLDSDGVTAWASTAYLGQRAYKFSDGTNVMGWMGAYYAASVSSHVKVYTAPVTGRISYLNLEAEAPAGIRGQVSLYAISGSESCGLGLHTIGTTKLAEFIDCDVEFPGDLQMTRSGTTYTGYVFVPLATPLTSTSWDGDAFSDVATSTQLDLSAVFGAPAGIQAVLFKIATRDSVTWGTAGLYFSCGPSATQWTAAVCRPAGGDVWNDNTAPVPCDANGDVWYRINASGTGTMDIYLEIWGYWI
jgi:hypothetical protein